jgi:tRNA(Phe) wybutosine-synthesizing methylase Tyw3
MVPCLQKAKVLGATGEAVFKFEPMVMHIQVQSVQLAQQLVCRDWLMNIMSFCIALLF